MQRDSRRLGERASSPRGDFPEIASATGNAPAPVAGEYGRVWWRAFKLAEQLERPDEEVKAFKSIAHRWYAIRDRG